MLPTDGNRQTDGHNTVA